MEKERKKIIASSIVRFHILKIKKFALVVPSDRKIAEQGYRYHRNITLFSI